MIRIISTVVDEPGLAQKFLGLVLGDARARNIYTYLTVLTAAPLVAAELAPLGSLYIPENELRADALEAIAALRAAIGGDNDTLLVKGIYGDVSWLAHDLRNEDDIADLAVLGPGETWAVPWLRRRTVDTLLMASGTPLLLLPEDKGLPPFRHITLGWKPSAQAIRTVRAIAALAEPGAKVDVVTVGPKPTDAAMAPQGHCGIADYLTRHGFEAECHWVEREHSTAAALEEFAIKAKADVLAVGGFAHSRVREIVLGGVTRSLVRRAPLPVLMAHYFAGGGCGFFHVAGQSAQPNGRLRQGDLPPDRGSARGVALKRERLLQPLKPGLFRLPIHGIAPVKAAFIF